MDDLAADDNAAVDAADAVGSGVDYSCYSSFSRLASSVRLLRNAGVDHCYESSQVHLNIYCHGTGLDVVGADDIHDTASLLRHIRRIVAFRGMEEREGGNCVVEQTGAELQTPSESKPDRVASAAFVAVPHPAEGTLSVAPAVDDRMGMVAADAGSPHARDEEEEKFSVMAGA